MILKNIPVRHLPMFMQVIVHLFQSIESIRCCVSSKSREASGEADRSDAFFHLVIWSEISSRILLDPPLDFCSLQSVKSWLSKAPICFNSLRFHSKSATVCLEYLWTLNCHLKCVYCMLIDWNIFIVTHTESAWLYKCLMYV